MKYPAALAFLAAIIAANYATTHYGLVPVGLGLTATAGTWFAGATFVLRDTVDDHGGRSWVLALIAAGAVLSWVLADGRIAIASGVAFAASELADFAVYRPLRRRGYLRAAVASNIVGATLDTILFLTIAGFPLWGSFAGQLVGKLAITGAVLVLVGGTRAVLRQPVQPSRP